LSGSNVRADLAALLGFLNAHLTQATGAHAATAISTAGAGGDLNAVNVEASLQEIADAFKANHFRLKDTNPGQHQTIQQPTLPNSGGLALILDSNAAGVLGARFRVYADTSATVWFTLNASWTGGVGWTPDSTTLPVSGFRISLNDFVLFNHDATASPFT